MMEQHIKSLMALANPEMPEHFRQHVQRTLDRLERETAGSVPSGRRHGSRLIRRGLAIALSAALLLGTAALAGGSWGLLDELAVQLGMRVSPQAEGLMQSDLFKTVINNVEITVREAGYDGRTLLVRYGYRILDDETVYDNSRIAEAEGELYAHGLNRSMYQLWIDGQGIHVPDGWGVTEGGQVPGEIIYSDYLRLDHEGVRLNGPTQITLPLGERLTEAELHELWNASDRLWRQPDHGVITFTYDAGEIQSRITTLQPGRRLTLPQGTVQTEETCFTPLMTYITLALQADEEAQAAWTAEHGPDDRTIFDGWLSSLALVDGNGQPVFPAGTGLYAYADEPGHTGRYAYGQQWAEFTYPYMKNIPDVLYLAPVKDGKADLAAGILVKE